MSRRCPAADCFGGRVSVYPDQGDSAPCGEADCDRCGGTGLVDDEPRVVLAFSRPTPTFTEEELDAMEFEPLLTDPDPDRETTIDDIPVYGGARPRQLPPLRLVA